MRKQNFTIVTLLLLISLGTPSPAQIYQINTVAGGGPNNVPALSASINAPNGFAADAAGNVFVSDAYFPRVLKLDTKGIVSVVAGDGLIGYSGDGGPPTQAEFRGPAGLSVDGLGNVFIADEYNSVIRKVMAATGIIQTVAGNGAYGSSGDGGPATKAELKTPVAVSVDGSGNIFIADGSSNKIREVIAATGIIQTVAGNGTQGSSGDGGKATQAELYSPSGVSVDGSGNLFIADTQNNKIREVYAATGIIQTVVGNGTAGYSGDGGPASQAEIKYPTTVFVDGLGNIFIADSANAVIREVYAATGIIETVVGNGMLGYSGDGGKATQAEISSDLVLVDSAEDIFVADYYHNVVREVFAATGIIQTVAGNSYLSYGGDGDKATQAQLYSPAGVFVDDSGNLFIADSGNSVIREVAAETGIVQTIAGSGIKGYSGDGGPAVQAALWVPEGEFVDTSGNLFIADSMNNVIREVAAGTGIITTIAGNGTGGYSGDGGPATQAELGGPAGVFVDRAGNIFIADYGFYVGGCANNLKRRDSTVYPPCPPPTLMGSAVRKVDAATGIIQTVAGNGTPGYSGDGGPASQAEVNGPTTVFVDGSGNIFIADTLNSVLREVVAATGIIQTVAGNGTVGYTGDGGKAANAEVNLPSGLFVDDSGNLFFTDTGNSVLREIYAATGTIQTIAGNGKGGFSGDGGWATNSELAAPSGLSLDSAGDISFADLGSARIRRLTPVDFQVAASPSTITVTAGQSVETTLTITPKNGFNQQVIFTCTGLPVDATCSASSVTPNGLPVRTTMTITTAGPSAKLRSNPTCWSGGSLHAMLLLGLVGLGGLVSCGGRPRSCSRLLSFLAVLMVSSMWMTACGGGTERSLSGGTPVGTYTISLQSTGGPITKITTLMLKVQ